MNLEKVSEGHKQSTFNMTDILGQFLRFMHLILICFLSEESKKANMYPTNPNLVNDQANLFFDR